MELKTSIALLTHTSFDTMKILIFLLLQTVLLSISRDVQLVAADYGRQEQPKKTYIIHMEKSKKPAVFIDHFNWYNSCLTSVSDSANMLYTYTHVIDGFSTSMSEEEAELLKKQPGVVSVIPEIRYEIHTTRSPSFLGLPNKAFSPGSKELSNLVIGVLDSGVWPKSQSYNDKGLGPIPSSWKGECEAGKNFDRSSCNKKLIGARFFYKGYEAHLKHPIDENLESKSPKDDLGHGTHTSSIAAGSAVPDASLFGYASGTATGMAPTARIAIYKAYWRGGSFGADVLAAVEKAIEDGVHIISMSLGSGSRDYYKDNFAIATFAAIERGILVTASAGNSGPDAGTLFNIPPWTFTVGAGTIDRDFPASITLGNGKTYKGVSGLYDGKPLQDKLVPLFPGLCLPGLLNPKDVTGKIVICNLAGREISRVNQSLVVKVAGGVGMILTREDVSHGDELKAEADLVPTVAVSLEKGNEIKKYIRSAANPTAKFILEGTKVGVQPSPIVAAFSSRGPNTRTPEILKPDIIAPGVNILAAWPGDLGPSGLDQDERRVSYNIKSGTSMACPHVSGLAALIKSVHPDWNPAIIRSAMMTTAYTEKNGKTIQDVVTGKAATPFDYGAGHVDPVAALDPGLVYDITVEDYIRFLCALKYTKEQIKIVTRRDFDCNNEKKKYIVGDLNYPSFAVLFNGNGKSTTVTYTRTLTNVGGSPATYKVSVSKVDAVEILVKPQTLTFKKAEKLTYTVTFTATSVPSLTNRFARLEWSDGKHVVGSPIAFSWSSNFIGNQSYDITMTKNPHNYVLI